MKKQRVVVGLSGGVDSAITAYLLKKQGHEVIGVFMKNWEGDDDDEHCSSRQDWLDAASVADVLGIEIEHINFATEYKDRVFSIFLSEYQAGRTPNPDILCNAEIKFKAFLDHAITLGADRMATGHYARVRPHPSQSGLFQLLKGIDASKDQSYFLHRLHQNQLAHSLFPLGDWYKKDVRRLATEIGLPNATKKDSTGICFIGERPFRAFLQRYVHQQPGAICAPDGRVLGQHQGLSFYTLGQRQGLGIGGVKGATTSHHEPWFVAHKDLKNNLLWVVQGHDHPWLLSQNLTFGQFHAIDPSHTPTTLAAKTRYRQKDAPCHLIDFSKYPTPPHPTHDHVSFHQPQWSVTPGQSVVFYEGDVCLGGGVIEDMEARQHLKKIIDPDI